VAVQASALGGVELDHRPGQLRQRRGPHIPRAVLRLGVREYWLYDPTEEYPERLSYVMPRPQIRSVNPPPGRCSFTAR